MKTIFQKRSTFTSFSKALVITWMFFSFVASACQCPLTSLGMQECDKYEIIFKGKVLSVKDCADKFGEATFQVDELYKGNATKNFKVLFECNQECSAKFIPGEEWIIYSRYKQMENALMNWCSRSRKYFKVEQQDYYTSTYGNDYYDEVKFLREKLGIHRLLADSLTRVEERNLKPSANEIIIILLCSIAAIVMFYYLFNRFVR